MKNSPSSPHLRIRTQVSTTPLYENKAYLTQKYQVEKLPARQIAVLIGCGHSTINAALERLGIKKERRFSGHIPYGYKMLRGRRVPHTREQKIIQQMTNRYAKGWSATRIAAWLDKRKISPPSNEKNWYPGTVLKLVRTKQLGIKIVPQYGR